MRISQLECENFRNLENNIFIPDKQVNVIYGKNAQGKTNLLEALWLFTGGKSFRGAKDGELVKFGSDHAKLHLLFFSQEREQEASISIQAGKKSVVINGIAQRSASTMIGKFCAVIFSPDHLSFIKEGPSFRRNFIDGALCQVKPVYVKLLYQYHRILNQRNALLKDIPRHSELLDTLDIWDEKLSYYGEQVSLERISYIQKLKEPVIEIYNGISQRKETIQICYHSGINNMTIEQCLQGSMMSCLKKARNEDVACGFTTCGPHRDDLIITIDGVSARSFASQGQQRSAVLALKLAEAQLLKNSLGENPIVFLDDVMSELDFDRQDYLLNHLKDQQVFITCCDPENAGKEVQGKKFEMKNGILKKINEKR